MAVQRAAGGVGDLLALALAAVVHVRAVARADSHRSHRDAVAGQQVAEDVAGLPAQRGAQHHRHAERRHHARLPHALAPGVDVDVRLAGAVLDGDGQDGQRGEDDNGVGRVRHVRFVPAAGGGQSAGAAVGVGLSSEVSARAAAVSRPVVAVRIASGTSDRSCSTVPSPGTESPGRAASGAATSGTGASGWDWGVAAVRRVARRVAGEVVGGIGGVQVGLGRPQRGVLGSRGGPVLEIGVLGHGAGYPAREHDSRRKSITFRSVAAT